MFLAPPTIPSILWMVIFVVSNTALMLCQRIVIMVTRQTLTKGLSYLVQRRKERKRRAVLAESVRKADHFATQRSETASLYLHPGVNGGFVVDSEKGTCGGLGSECSTCSPPLNTVTVHSKTAEKVTFSLHVFKYGCHEQCSNREKGLDHFVCCKSPTCDDEFCSKFATPHDSRPCEKCGIMCCEKTPHHTDDDCSKAIAAEKSMEDWLP